MNDKREILLGSEEHDRPFSPVVGFGQLVFVSGCVGRDPVSSDIAVGDVYSQTRQALANIKSHLARVGIPMENTLKATVFLTDMQLIKEMNRAYLSFFRTGLPARSCVAVVDLPDPDALVEIEVVVHR